jgi:LPS O-antigen subunit length determinant protein (WzzB/FepE family)
MADNSENKESSRKFEIDLFEVLRGIWHGRKTIIKTIIVFCAIGILSILISPKEYKSEVTLVVETNSSGTSMSGLLQQFGGLAGISLDKKEKDALSPDLYPEVIKSTPFLLQLMNRKVTLSKGDSTILISQFIKNHTRSSFFSILKQYSIGLPGKIIGWIKGKDETPFKPKYPLSSNDSIPDTTFAPIQLSQDMVDITEELSDRITTEQDFKKSNKFTISVEMQDPMVVAQISSYVVKSLTKYITEYRTKKAKKDLAFVISRTADAEENYLKTQDALANYKDRNKNVILSSVLAEEERLESEYNLAYDVFNTLSKQLEQAKIKVQESTPVFTLMEPAQVPINKSKPNTILVLITMICIGGFMGIIILFIKQVHQILFRK